jgi:hypothetical protein
MVGADEVAVDGEEGDGGGWWAVGAAAVEDWVDVVGEDRRD